MKCKRHPCEEGVGVCASCLRERLFALIAAQNELAAGGSAAAAASTDGQRRRRTDPILPPPNPHLSFPRSVSPYVSHRRSLGSEQPNGRLHRFFSTPPPALFASAADDGDGDRSHRRSFSLWTAVFGHSRSEPSEPRSSSSWLSALIRRMKSRKMSEEAASPFPAADRGLSPVRYDEEDGDGGSASSTDSSADLRRPTPTPMRRFTARHGRSAGGRGMSGFAVCLSPLVRTSPNCRRSQQTLPSAVSGDHRSDGNHRMRRHVSAGDPASMGVNRSRKLTDFGRFK